ncbi:DEAD/DEAH box helicase [Candidatus Pacearchaeota archaeon]|nr:DEAD/DEAH box helicase [Candidatus Pacearchaeota archaeon]MBD3283771.1 DEAD/DEAH box helicase [Candidatus Pacearchaeota archaeon]
MEKFENLLGKDNSLLISIRQRGFREPSEIQEKTIPRILEGRDVIAGASTGSGKTLAFATGLIKNIRKDFGIQGLVLTPTRELAEQITKEISDFSRKKDLDILAVYGGVSINHQIKRLKYADIVVGTPGRILDHINRNSIDLSRVNTLVLDEADRMLDMGFRDDVEKIILRCQKKRQTLLFSATISQDIFHLSEKYMRNPIEISAEEYVDPRNLEQEYYDIVDNLKYSLLRYLLEREDSKLVMIFCNTRTNVDFVSKNLKFMGIDNLPIHGGFSQEKRNRMIEKFHSNKTQILVATDVAARGLDIKGVTHIYNYNIPSTQKEYIHRIGRTARAGKKGKVINLVSSRDYDNFNTIINGDFIIKKRKSPYLKRAKIRWIPEKKHDRFKKKNFQNNFKKKFSQKHLKA